MSKRGKHQERDDALGIPNIPMSDADAALFGQIQKADDLMPSPDQAIVAKSAGIVSLGHKVEVSPVGAVFAEDLSLEEFHAFFEAVKAITKSLQWIIGDWVAYGEDKLDFTYQELAYITGYKAKTLRNFAYVARNVPMSLRKDTLNFGHHSLVAALPEHQQLSWLDYAIRHKLPVAKLRMEIAGTPTLPDDDDPAEVKSFGRNARLVSQLVVAMGQGKPVDAENGRLRIEAMRRWLDRVEGMLGDG